MILAPEKFTWYIWLIMFPWGSTGPDYVGFQFLSYYEFLCFNHEHSEKEKKF